MILQVENRHSLLWIISKTSDYQIKQHPWNRNIFRNFHIFVLEVNKLFNFWVLVFLLLEYLSKSHLPKNASKGVNIYSVMESDIKSIWAINMVDLRRHVWSGSFVRQCFINYFWKFVFLCLIFFEFEVRNSKVSDLESTVFQIWSFLQFFCLLQPFLDILFVRLVRKLKIIEIDKNVIRLEVKMHITLIIKELQRIGYLRSNNPNFISVQPLISSFSNQTRKTRSVAKLNKHTAFIFCFNKKISKDFVQIFTRILIELDEEVNFLRDFLPLLFVFVVKHFNRTHIYVFKHLFISLILFLPLVSLFLSSKVYVSKPAWS